jgi:ABC transporter substrate binding protein
MSLMGQKPNLPHCSIVVRFEHAQGRWLAHARYQAHRSSDRSCRVIETLKKGYSDIAPLSKNSPAGFLKARPSRPERCLNANRQSDSFTSLEIAPRKFQPHSGRHLFTNELAAKRMQLLRELVPADKRVALLTNPTDPANELLLRDVETAATGQQILVFEAATRREIDAAFDGLGQEKVDALFVGGGAFLITRRVQLAVLTARYAVPAAYSQRAFVEAGGLMSYGTNLADTFRQVGAYAARILKGAKSMDLPVMQATKFELVINLNTARALRFEVPPTLLARADEVIE